MTPSAFGYSLAFADVDDDPTAAPQYSVIADKPLAVGSLVGSPDSAWEVIEVRDSPGGLLELRDRLGQSVPVVGTIICRATDPPETGNAPHRRPPDA